MSKPQVIWVVMEPKRGEYPRITSTSHVSEGDAIRKSIRRWLPEDYFPDLPGDVYYGALSDLWDGMKRVGWDIIEIEVSK